MSDPEKVMIICVPVTAKGEPFPGAGRRPCDKCGQEVWFAQSSEAVVAAHPDSEVICNDCALPILIAQSLQGHPMEFKAAPGASEEFRRSIEGD